MTTRDQTIQWLGIRFAAPGGWQIVRHSPTPLRGGLVLVDRLRQRMQLNWTTLGPRDEPDLARMIEDYRAKQLETHPGAELVELTGPAGWVGVRRAFSGSDERVTRAVRYDAQTRRILEAILTTPADEEDVADEVLASIEAVEPVEGITRLRAFDLDVTTPRGWRLAHAEVRPADVTLRFAHHDEKGRETRQELAVRRMGMADSWWHGDGERFIARTSPRVRFAIGEARYGGRTVVRGVGVEPGPRGKRWLGFLRQQEDVLWHDAGANAVVHVSLLSWKKRDVTAGAFRIESAPAGPEPVFGRRAGSSKLERTVAPDSSRSLRVGVGVGVESPGLADLLAAVPVVNDAVREKQNGKTLILYVPIRRRWWMGPPFAWLPGVRFRKEKAVALDALGFEVWRSIDGKRTVEEIVDRFAEKHRLRFHEARIGVMAFLKMLLQRGLVVVALEKGPLKPA